MVIACLMLTKILYLYFSNPYNYYNVCIDIYENYYKWYFLVYIESSILRSLVYQINWTICLFMTHFRVLHRFIFFDNQNRRTSRTLVKKERKGKKDKKKKKKAENHSSRIKQYINFKYDINIFFFSFRFESINPSIFYMYNYIFLF